MGNPRRFFMRRLWQRQTAGTTAGSWARDVLLTVDDVGCWQDIQPNGALPRDPNITVIDAPVLPGLVNAHSHAFQRAMAGLTERSDGGSDNFWSWREQMYRIALRISPEQLEAIATQLYMELLRGGYTHVCEFHYLHNNLDGQPYADTAELSLALVRAAQTAGIGLTLLPTLYQHSGFGGQAPRSEQRRFLGTPDRVLRLADRIAALGLPLIDVGIAVHSLRAVDTGALHELAKEIEQRADQSWPVHIHIAEQLSEVDDCLRHHGQRPIEWLLNNASVGPRWNLVHATHTTHAELGELARRGAAIVICPSTEANLGDGVFDLPYWLSNSGRWSIGSDSHVTRCASEELRLLEYAQRLLRGERNVAANAGGQRSTADLLYGSAVAGGSAAAGVPVAGFSVGQRADFCVLDDRSDALLGIPDERLLDATLFSSPGASVLASYVAGQMRDPDVAAIRHSFRTAMQQIWLDSSP